jgi:hypothetical protein
MRTNEAQAARHAAPEGNSAVKFEHLMSFVRRYLLLLALMFWVGGFTFHGAVVVQVGNQVLGSHLEQGYITRSASNYLNLAGAVALVLWAWDIVAAGRPGGRRRFCWSIWTVLVLSLGLLVWLHARLDDLLASDSFRILDRSRFRELHRLYLHVSTIQWVGSLVLLGETLLAWQRNDQSSWPANASRAESLTNGTSPSDPSSSGCTVASRREESSR